MSGGIVATIGVDDAGLLKRSATNAANGWNRINERQQLRDVVGVRASQDRNERNAVGVYEDVVLGTGSRAIGGVRASFSPAPTARTDDESTAAYDRSIWPAARNLSSSNSCSWSHTPAFCQSLNRRQHVAPEPKPRRVGKWFQRIPVLNTNRMPLRAARSDTRGRPGSLFARSFAGVDWIRLCRIRYPHYAPHQSFADLPANEKSSGGTVAARAYGARKHGSLSRHRARRCP